MMLSEIGEALRSARKTSKRSQAEVAGALGMSRATISSIENGTVNEIGVRKLIALATSLGLELSIGPRRARPTLQELRARNRAAKFRT